jgi:uncharacterized membrane protein YfcA
MELFIMFTTKQFIILLITGLLAGAIAGAMGVGGAIIIIPFLVFFLGMEQHEAQGTSLLVLVFPVGIFAVMEYAKQGYVNYKFAAVLILAFLLGSYLGSKFAVNIPAKTLQKIFAVLLLVIGTKMLLGK